MIVYRICKEKYADNLSGIGAELYGGRWNSKGVPMLYASSNISLCTLEMLVQINHQLVPHDFILLFIQLPTTAHCKIIFGENLPLNWNSHPPNNHTQKIGDEFILNSQHLCMHVPSAIIPNENNILLNPHSKHFSNLKVIKKIKYQIDGRLLDGI
jgi:RES domain-containing protein